MPETLSEPVSLTRAFWIHVMTSKTNATIKEAGDQIGWEEDEEAVGPRALLAKASLLKVIPYILPPEEPHLYRLILDHLDFGIHNTSIVLESPNQPRVTSMYDWETGTIVPAILSEPLVAAGPVDLITDEQGKPAVTSIPEGATEADLDIYSAWADHYIQVCFVPSLPPSILENSESGLSRSWKQMVMIKDTEFA